MLKKTLFLRTARINLTSKLSNSTFDYTATNEPIFDYMPDSAESNSLKQALKNQWETVVDIPIIIGDEEIRTDMVRYQVAPFYPQHKIARYYYADRDLIEKAIKSNVSARKRWEVTAVSERAKIFLRAADMIASTQRDRLLATTILGQGKTVYQAEIDAACELVDFMRFNAQVYKKKLFDKLSS